MFLKGAQFQLKSFVVNPLNINILNASFIYKQDPWSWDAFTFLVSLGGNDSKYIFIDGKLFVKMANKLWWSTVALAHTYIEIVLLLWWNAIQIVIQNRE